MTIKRSTFRLFLSKQKSWVQVFQTRAESSVGRVVGNEVRKEKNKNTSNTLATTERPRPESDPHPPCARPMPETEPVPLAGSVRWVRKE